MIWLVIPLIVIVPVGILLVLLQEEVWVQQHRPPMGWMRRLWMRPQDRRHCSRYRATIAMTYRIAGVSEPPVASLTRDVSFGGVGIVVYEKLPLGTVLELTLRCDPPLGLVRVQGLVQWVREIAPPRGDPRRLFWAGVQIVHANPESAEQVRMVLQRLSSLRTVTTRA